MWQSGTIYTLVAELLKQLVHKSRRDVNLFIISLIPAVIERKIQVSREELGIKKMKDNSNEIYFIVTKMFKNRFAYWIQCSITS